MLRTGIIREILVVLKYEEAQNKFSANVEIFADGKSAANSSLQGKYYILTEV